VCDVVIGQVMSYLTKQAAGTQTSRSIEQFLREMQRLLGKVLYI
jgi:hypothetical protein